MTRQEFLNDVTSWSDLIDFCGDVDCDLCLDIYDSDEIEEVIGNKIENMLNSNSWETIFDVLSDIPRNCDWYYRTDYDEITEADDYIFIEKKEEVLDYCDRYDLWDDEEDEEEESLEEYEPVDEIKEDFDIEELFNSCVGLGYQKEA